MWRLRRICSWSRVPSHFVVQIPDALLSDIAGPMLCGEVTVYSPLKQQGAGPGKTAGDVGIGGLGHLGILLAKAMGAEAVTISHTESNRNDTLKMGPSNFIATSKGESVFKKNARTLDFISTELLV